MSGRLPAWRYRDGPLVLHGLSYLSLCVSLTLARRLPACRYRDVPLVLHGLSFSVNGNEKIGVAGRTG